MSRALRAELLKVRTVLLPLGMLLASSGATVLVALLEYSRSGAGGKRIVVPLLNGAAGQKVILSSTELALILALAMGVIVTAGEFRHHTATSTALAQPARGRVLAAKEMVAAGLGAVFGLCAAIVTSVAMVAFVAAKGYSVVVPTSTILQDAAGAIVACALLAAAGAAVGALVRSQMAAVVAVLLWAFIAEPSLGALFPTGAPYFPFTAARTMAGAGSFEPGVTALGFPLAALLVAAVAAVLAVLAARTTQRRDIA